MCHFACHCWCLLSPLQLDKAVVAQGNVENWLGALLKQSLHSVHLVIKNAFTAISDPNMELIEFLNSFPAQVSAIFRYYIIQCTSSYYVTYLILIQLK